MPIWQTGTAGRYHKWLLQIRTADCWFSRPYSHKSLVAQRATWLLLSGSPQWNLVASGYRATTISTPGRGSRSGRCPDARQCPISHGQPRVVQAYLEQEGIDVMGWPARSPDLNPIEHLWDILQRLVSGRQNPPATVQALTAAAREEWNGINLVTVRRLIRSMPRRCRGCIQSRGDHCHKII